MGMINRGTERDVDVLRFSCFSFDFLLWEILEFRFIHPVCYLMHTSTGASELGLAKMDSITPWFSLRRIRGSKSIHRVHHSHR